MKPYYNTPACKSLMKMLKTNGVSGSFAMVWLVLPDLAAIFLERQADAKSSFQKVQEVIKEGTYCVYHGDRKHSPFLTSMALTESTLLIIGCGVGVFIACCLSFTDSVGACLDKKRWMTDQSTGSSDCNICLPPLRLASMPCTWFASRSQCFLG